MTNKNRPSSKPIPKVYEDDNYVVFDKPPGLLVIPTPAAETRTLTSIVNDQYTLDKDYKLHICHRLDRDTSGVIVFAKGKHAQKILMEEFSKHDVKKTYRALVQGRLKRTEGEFNMPVLDFDEKRFRKHSQPKSALTRYKLIRQYNDFADVKIDLLTGRTNQIRIHFKDAGHPLVGERKYAFGRDYKIKFRRVALHAESISWNDPITGKAIFARSEMPSDLAAFLERYK